VFSIISVIMAIFMKRDHSSISFNLFSPSSLLLQRSWLTWNGLISVKVALHRVWLVPCWVTVCIQANHLSVM